MNRSSLVSATVLIIIVGNHVFILVALTQSVVIWFTCIANLISDSDVCWQLLALWLDGYSKRIGYMVVFSDAVII